MNHGNQAHMHPADPSVTITEMPGRTSKRIQYEMQRPMNDMLRAALAVSHVTVREDLEVAEQCIRSTAVTSVPRICTMHVQCTYTAETPETSSVHAEVRVEWASAAPAGMVKDLILDTAASWVHAEVDYVTKCLD